MLKQLYNTMRIYIVKQFSKTTFPSNEGTEKLKSVQLKIGKIIETPRF